MNRSIPILCVAFSLLLAAAEPLGADDSFIDEQTQTLVRQFLAGKFGEGQKERIDKGVGQVAALWLESDGSAGEFQKFCKENFLPAGPALNAAFARLEAHFETLAGHFNRISLDLKRPLDEDAGEIGTIDELFGQYDPGAHLTDDLFANRIAFLVMLNFPHYTLSEKGEAAARWNRLDWAMARLGDHFTARVPARVRQQMAGARTRAQTYISEYDIYLGRLLGRDGQRLFPPDLKLISHWGLRDEIRARYADRAGLARQETIYEVFKRIVQQDIPRPVINSPACEWNPFSNRLWRDGKEVAWTPEPNSRYLHLLDIFHAARELDACHPAMPTYIQRSFESGREIPREQVSEMFTQLLSAPEVRQVALLVEKRLGRKLRPFDIWYNGFRGSAPQEAELDRLVARRYPDAQAFEQDLRDILVTLGFGARPADFIAARIEVDAARGIGHAWGPAMRSEKAHLRTRVPAAGLNYKGFNIALHELGHCVEQVLSMHRADHPMLAGVPNSAFSEAFAFIFQGRDLEVLGLNREDSQSHFLQALDALWSCYEIMGVSLVDMRVWEWLYQNPAARPEDLRRAVISIARDVWNKYYADVFGVRDQVILAVYSHMIHYPLYLSDYPLGQLIEFQIGRHLAGRSLGAEMERMCAVGRLTPDAWMKIATGSEISVKPLLEAAAEALKKTKR